MDEKTQDLFLSQLLLTVEKIANQLNEIADRQIKILERSEMLAEKNALAFKLAGEDFTRRIIEQEVKRELEKEKKILQYKNRRYGQGG